MDGWRSLVGYSPRGRKELGTTERLHFLSFFQQIFVAEKSERVEEGRREMVEIKMV